MRHDLRSNTDAGISNNKLHRIFPTTSASRAERDQTAVGRELDGVGEEI